ncbi:MAG TPA: glycoside hydrolase family 172 protein, partial [Opitutus sp.]|nr:glycoside hydrolase family 172 protein [Opitutus sp.]
MTRFFSYADLVKRLVDFERLATVPVVGERTALVSSYDRASVYDEANDRYVHWGANADGAGFVRQEGENQVLAEIPGPGCIWRIWAATAGEGPVRIYLDGATEPAIDLPFAGYFDGKNEPFNRSNLVYTTAAMGHNNYTPIPFQTSCKIVAAPGWGKYYHFNYTLFPEKTRLRTFKRHLSAEDASALDAADRKLGRCGENPEMQRPRGHVTTSCALKIAAGATAVVADLRGASEIFELRVKVELPTEIEAQRQRLRELTLAITWDDDTEPAVWSPLGDFFGCAGGAVPFRTLAAGLRDDGTFYCFWRMPYANRALVSVTNESAETVAMTWEIEHAPLSRSIDSYLRFHAKWHRDGLPVRADRAPDWTLLQTEGTGRYVGTQLHVWNPRGGWWGEGDEKFFVDGEKFPSSFGTGTEDYFGYAWSSGKTFVQALHSQPVNQDNRGHVSVNRWHLSDDVPFQTQFEGSIEKYFPNTNPCEFAAVVFWYLSPGGFDPLGAVPVAERIGPWVWPQIVREEGVIEAEELRVVKEQWPHATSVLDAVARGIPAGVA